jgi:hypothetical protein
MNIPNSFEELLTQIQRSRVPTPGHEFICQERVTGFNGEIVLDHPRYYHNAIQETNPYSLVEVAVLSHEVEIPGGMHAGVPPRYLVVTRQPGLNWDYVDHLNDPYRCFVLYTKLLTTP